MIKSKDFIPDKPISKKVFTNPYEAIEALRIDKLGTVYYKANSVFVVTAFGLGRFSNKVWKLANGSKNSIKK